MNEIFITAFFAAVMGATILLIMRYPLQFVLLAFLLTMGLMVYGVSKADTLEVSAVIESEADRVSMQDAVNDAASLLRDQLGLDVKVIFVDVSTVAAHTSAPFLLDALKGYRVNHSLQSDATVLFTRRELKGYAGIATDGPACSASASAIVVMRNDGNDGAILAHELLHTVGVPHDATPGWLMSEGISRDTVRAMSPDSVLTFRAAGTGECMSTPAATPPAVVKAPPAAPSTGGGGSCDWLLLLCLLVLVLKVRT